MGSSVVVKLSGNLPIPFLSSKMTNNIARRESPGKCRIALYSLKASNKSMFAALSDGGTISTVPAILAGLYCQSPLATGSSLKRIQRKITAPY